MFRFNKHYFIAAMMLLITEALIATFMHDRFIRPFGGDFLVVILQYCLIKSFLDTSVMGSACFVLLFSYAIEISQYFHLTTRLGWQHSRVADLLLGHFFSMTDMLMYTLGILLVLGVEKIRVDFKLRFQL